ncbi:MAG: dienelactone hydrolase family protein [Rhodospirillales bacterium]
MIAPAGAACKGALVAAVFLFLSIGNACAEERVTFLNQQGEEIGAVYVAPRSGTLAPAVVMLHGCGGLFTKSGKIASRERAWMEILAAEGWALLLPDSFGSRGHGSLCKVKDRPVKPDVERPFDALAALTWLSRQPDIDPKKIALMGWSNGAMTGLHTIRDGAAALPMPGQSDFRTAVVFYPGCVALKKDYPDYRPRVPALIQHGALDDWTLAEPCRELVLKVRENPDAPPMFIDIYPDSYHGFDHPKSKVRTITTRHSGYKTGERKVHVGTNPEAREKAIHRTLEWLRAHLS